MKCDGEWRVKVNVFVVQVEAELLSRLHLPNKSDCFSDPDSSPCVVDSHNFASTPAPSRGTKVIMSYQDTQLQLEYEPSH